MSEISTTSNKKGAYKSHIVPSVVTAALALSAAIPLTAALASQANPVSADVVPLSVNKTADDTCGVPSTTTTSAGHTSGTVLGASTTAEQSYPTPGSVYNQGNGNGNSDNNNGNTNTNGSGNGNGSGANANGNTQSNTGGLVGGVNAIVPVSALNGSLNDVLSGNTVSVPVLSNNNGNTVNTDVPVLNNVLNTLNSTRL